MSSRVRVGAAWVAALLILLSAARPALAGSGPEGQPVSLTSADGVKLTASWYPAKKARPGAALYLHMPARSGDDYRYLAALVAEHGLPGLTLDLRGHGGSRATKDGRTLDRDVFTAADWKAMAHDVAAAVSWLRDVRKVAPDRIQIVGADAGASLALLHAVGDPRIEALTLLSPGLGYQELNVKGQVAAYGARRLLMVLSEEDTYAVKSVDVMEEEAAGRALVQRYVGAGHGTRMLNREGGLEQFVLAWLLGTIGDDGQPAVQGATVGAQQKAVEGTSNRDLAAEERKRLDQQKKQIDKEERSIEADEAADEGAPRRWE